MDSPRLRLVKVVLQPVLVADDGESLREVQTQPITVMAADWPAFSGEKWPQLLAEYESQLKDPES